MYCHVCFAVVDHAQQHRFQYLNKTICEIIRHLASNYAYVGHSYIDFIYLEIKITVVFIRKGRKITFRAI